MFILSLAGIPPLAGFFGKFAVFAAALRMGGIAGPAGWLALLAIALSAVALYYYLIVLKQAWVAAPPERPGTIVVPAPPGSRSRPRPSFSSSPGPFPGIVLMAVP